MQLHVHIFLFSHHDSKRRRKTFNFSHKASEVTKFTWKIKINKSSTKKNPGQLLTTISQDG